MSTEHLCRLLGRYLGIPAEPVEGIDWQAVMALAEKNRVLPLLQAVITPSDDVSEAVQARLRDEARRSFAATALVADNLADIAGALSRLRWMLLRGPVLGQLVYDDPLHRPFGDLDILVTQGDRAEATRCLKRIGFALPNRAMPPRYYETVHLHYPLQRPGLAGPTYLELQWDIDHPFTLFTIDINDILERRVLQTMRGGIVPIPEVHDLLITLSIHAVKHAAPLPYWLQEGEVAAIVETGHLLHFMDIALLLRQSGSQIDPDVIARRCQSWGAADAVANSLTAIGRLWPRLEVKRFSMSAQPISPIKMWLYRRTGTWGFGQLPLLFFRPIRLLDVASYLLPPTEYLYRHVGKADLPTRIRHASRGAARLIKGGLIALGARLRGRFRVDG